MTPRLNLASKVEAKEGCGKAADVAIQFRMRMLGGGGGELWYQSACLTQPSTDSGVKWPSSNNTCRVWIVESWVQMQTFVSTFSSSLLI